MNSPAPNGRDMTTELVVDIVTLLESRGVAADSYQLYDTVDVEALVTLIGSSTGDTEIRFRVEGVDLVATKNGVGIVRDDH